MRAALFGIALILTACVSTALRAPRAVDIPLHRYVGKLRYIETSFPIGARLLFDSAGGLTLLSPGAAKSVRCEPYTRLAALHMSGERFDVDGCGPVPLAFNSFSVKPEAAVFDLMSLLPERLPSLDGLASLQTFAGAGLDVFVRVSGSHGPLWFEVDTANLDAVRISNRILDQLSLSPEQLQSLREGRTTEVTLSIDGLGPVAAIAGAADIIYDGVLNADLLERMKLVLDLKHSLGWAKLHDHSNPVA